MTESDRDSIVRAAFDYAEGWYFGDAERHARAYHDECIKRAYYVENGETHLSVLSPRTMVDLVAAQGVVDLEAVVEVIVDDVYADIASIRVYSPDWVDLVQLQRARGGWRLLHVTYEGREVSAPEEPADHDTVAGLCRRFAESWYRGDADAHVATMHPEWVERGYYVGAESGVTGMTTYTPRTSWDMCASGRYEVADCDFEVSVDSVHRSVASARIYSCHSITYLHASKARGEWLLLHGVTSPR